MPGDRVVCSPAVDDQITARIDQILPRTNYLIRPPLANLDALFLTFAVTDPEPDFLLLDKLLIVCCVLNISPVVLFTKADLQPEKATDLAAAYHASGFTTAVATVFEPEQLKVQLNALLRPHAVAAFAGPSGTGKSTLINTLLGEAVMETGAVSEKLGRGRHTTRHVELLRYNSAYITDTPGFSALELSDLGIEPEEVILGYPEFIRPAAGCRFHSCRHINEPLCAVADYVELLAPQMNSDPRSVQIEDFHPELEKRFRFADHFRERLERYRFFREQLDAIPAYRRKQRR